MIDQHMVSVLMTAYNREEYIAEAIQSVLLSTCKSFELIIVDDGSEDKTLEIARSFAGKDTRVQVHVNDRNLGDYKNRNRAASLARGKYIKYLDSDDFLYSHGLEVMVNSMEQFPEAGFGMLSRGDPSGPYPKLISPRNTYLEHFFGFGHLNRAPGSAIINRKVFNEMGGFSGRNVIGDSEFWFKISSYYPMVKIVDDLYWARTHDNQQKNTVSQSHYEQMRWKIAVNALNGPQCPLTKEEIKNVMRLMRRNRMKNEIFSYISRLQRFALQRGKDS